MLNTTTSLALPAARVRGEQPLPTPPDTPDTPDIGMPEFGVIYLLHFDRPYGHARHYMGWTTNLPERLAQHATGRGARLLAVVSAEGIGWQLARLWLGSRHRERAIKRQGGLSRCCPCCGVNPRTERFPAQLHPQLDTAKTADTYAGSTLPIDTPAAGWSR